MVIDGIGFPSYVKIVSLSLFCGCQLMFFICTVNCESKCTCPRHETGLKSPLLFSSEMPLTQQKRDYLLWMNRKKENTFPEYSEIEWKRRYRNGTSKRSSKPYQKTLKIESREPKKKKIFFSKLGPWEPKNNIAILGTESLLLFP